MKLNLGSDEVSIEGFLSVDISAEHCEPGLVADVRNLPFADDSIEEIYASHILEHLEWYEDPMAEWYRVLRPGGLIIVAIPDFLDAFVMMNNGVVNRYWLNCVVFGGVKLDDQMHPTEDDFAERFHNELQTHKQVITGSMLTNQMRPWFPDVQTVNGCYVRPRTMCEAIAQGHKPL